MSDRYLCWICKKYFYGLMSFASHVAQKHGISTIQYWDKYGYGNKKVKVDNEPEKVIFT